MKYWCGLIDNNRSYESALRYIEKYPATSYITRPEWEGVHFISKNRLYCILLKNGNILEICNKSDVWDTDKNDWLIVVITDEAVELLQEKDLI